ncbi:hypothetical protein LEP1GSC047_3106 [Leptospira inadai serovar Lyme str. 10]|uniref:Uncharacterized protein n=1 Tax=Leptospira inadai serovar Lyme str. 10 TaxID=1049790 RepID=V6HCD1_9LEPT|nr:hypothetical protein LEP1GSC047_3106 [Leptospira inadai serovar Lyme str. 10]
MILRRQLSVPFRDRLHFTFRKPKNSVKRFLAKPCFDENNLFLFNSTVKFRPAKRISINSGPSSEKKFQPTQKFN